MIFLASLLALALISILFKLYGVYFRRRKASQRAGLKYLGFSVNNKRILGFFHPYCNAGGGGERVLWTAIAAMQRSEKDLLYVVYSGDIDASKEEIIAKVKSRFAITLDPTSLHFVFLKSRILVESKTWPYFTLLGQSIGSMYLVWEAMSHLIPDLYIDTMGYAFTFFVVSSLCNIPIGAYVHYPTISTDMLARVRERKKWHTNQSRVAESSVLSGVKLFYYRIFMHHYASALRLASFLMVNSSWTKAHVDSILKHTDPFISISQYILLLPVKVLTFPHPLVSLLTPSHTSHQKQRRPVENSEIVYPPCDTRELASFPLEGREKIILSIAQFRPEKDHSAQLQAFAELLTSYPQYTSDTNNPKLVLIGGARNEEDQARVDALKDEARKLGIEDRVIFLINASYPTMLSWLQKCSIGVNTMVDEHFGINVVEYMAAGAIPVAHASGGPLNDIIVPFDGKPTGYHATTPTSYATAFHTVFSLSSSEDFAMRSRARAWAVKRFSEEEFVRGWEESGGMEFLLRT